MSKLKSGAADALHGVLRDGMTLAVGGFGLSGIPADLIEAVRDSGVRGLTVVSNNMGVDGKGLGILIEAGQVTVEIGIAPVKPAEFVVFHISQFAAGAAAA